jgi:hypothetical protein
MSDETIQDQTPRRAAAPAPNRESTDLGLVARLGARARQHKMGLNAAVERAERAEKALQEANDQIARLSTSTSGQRLTELEAQIRLRDYKSIFERACRDACVDPKMVDDLWEVMKLDTSKPQIEDADIVAAVEEQRTKRPRFFLSESDSDGPASAETAGGTAEATPSPVVERRPGPASGRTSAVGSGAPAVSEDLVKHDPAWVMRNWDRVQADAKAKVEKRRRA